LREGEGEALAAEVFLGLEIGFGVGLVFGEGVAVGLEEGVARGVGLGVGDGSSISLFTSKAFGVATVFFSSVSSSFNGSEAGFCRERFWAGFASFCCSAAARFSTLPSQTMSSGLDEARAAALQRISPAIRATCASAMRITFRQKDFAGFVTLNR
jgi:hypothetical protein